MEQENIIEEPKKKSYWKKNNYHLRNFNNSNSLLYVSMDS